MTTIVHRDEDISFARVCSWLAWAHHHSSPALINCSSYMQHSTAMFQKACWSHSNLLSFSIIHVLMSLHAISLPGVRIPPELQSHFHMPQIPKAYYVHWQQMNTSMDPTTRFFSTLPPTQKGENNTGDFSSKMTVALKTKSYQTLSDSNPPTLQYSELET